MSGVDGSLIKADAQAIKNQKAQANAAKLRRDITAAIQNQQIFELTGINNNINTDTLAGKFAYGLQLPLALVQTPVNAIGQFLGLGNILGSNGLLGKLANGVLGMFGGGNGGGGLLSGLGRLFGGGGSTQPQPQPMMMMPTGMSQQQMAQYMDFMKKMQAGGVPQDKTATLQAQKKALEAQLASVNKALGIGTTTETGSAGKKKEVGTTETPKTSGFNNLKNSDILSRYTELAPYSPNMSSYLEQLDEAKGELNAATKLNEHADVKALKDNQATLTNNKDGLGPLSANGTYTIAQENKNIKTYDAARKNQAQAQYNLDKAKAGVKQYGDLVANLQGQCDKLKSDIAGLKTDDNTAANAVAQLEAQLKAVEQELKTAQGKLKSAKDAEKTAQTEFDNAKKIASEFTPTANEKKEDIDKKYAGLEATGAKVANGLALQEHARVRGGLATGVIEDLAGTLNEDGSVGQEGRIADEYNQINNEGIALADGTRVKYNKDSSAADKKAFLARADELANFKKEAQAREDEANAKLKTISEQSDLRKHSSFVAIKFK